MNSDPSIPGSLEEATLSQRLKAHTAWPEAEPQDLGWLCRLLG